MRRSSLLFFSILGLLRPLLDLLAFRLEISRSSQLLVPHASIEYTLMFTMILFLPFPSLG